VDEEEADDRDAHDHVNRVPEPFEEITTHDLGVPAFVAEISHSLKPWLQS
jgi:hypothetical protein